MNKKGFTLVELLAVVVVLAILSLLVIPVVSGIIENAKKGAVKSSAEGLLRAADMYYARHMDRMKEPVEFEINDGIQVSEEKLDYNGNIKMGYLMLFSETKKAVCVDDGTYSAYKGVNDKRIEVIEGICTGEYDSETESYMVSQTSKGFTNLSIKSYTDANKLPKSGNTNDIAIITETKITGYYVSSVAPSTPDEGMVWVVQSNNSPYYLESAYVRIGVSYTMQYEKGKWVLKHAYVYNDGWKLLYYVDMTDGNINLENSNLGDIEIENTYEYTGEYQEFTATFSGYYNIQLWGAAGGTNSASYPGGNGAYTAGDIYLDAGETIYIYVGEKPTSPTGGWNGGGDGLAQAAGSAGGGGGSTDIRKIPTSSKNTWNEFESLKSRIMVAAGGGGGSYYGSDYYGSGGSGGGIIGYDGTSYRSHAGTGASQTFGGYSTYTNAAPNITLGAFGYGGRYYGTYSQAGGGSGYYGGGAGSYAGAGGGGGSSYISGHVGCNSISIDSELDQLVFTGSYYHYSNKYFKNTKMVDGNGYDWTAIKQTFVKMPTHDGSSTMVGNTGNGYAKIKLVSINIIADEEIKKEINSEKRWDFSYSKNYQTFEVKKSGYYNVQLWGAEGNTNSTSYPGGKGSYTSGNIYLKKGDKLYIYVGGKSILLTGGWNGGGDGLAQAAGSAGGGGGSTDIRLVNTSKASVWNEFESLKSRIMVASGGGGGSYYGSDYYGSGGSGGGLIGYTGSSLQSHAGTGGTQSLGGYSTYNQDAYSSTHGNFGYGGKYYGTWSQAGGGSGYYGGGAGSYAGAGGGGGSSYISGHIGCNSILSNSTSSNLLHSGSSFHYSGYYFKDTVMIDGNGYSWTNFKGALTNMPDYLTSNLKTGNSGNGYAIIELIDEKDVSDSTISENLIENDNIWNYDFSSSYQTFTAPKNGTYKIELWGAEGNTNSTSYPGGKGAYTSGEIYLNKGTKFYIYVGAKSIIPTTAGGWNGGGTGLTQANGSAGGGGGSTDIRVISTPSIISWNNDDSLKSRIMVAAGGGGGSYYGSDYRGAGGAGGGLIGYEGTSSQGSAGSGATQLTGGYSSYNSDATAITMGGFGYGGKYYGTWSQGGGGAGWYGGGAGSYAGAAGGGGSSYISGHSGCIGVDSSGNPKTQEYSEISDSISYTGYKFTNTQMIDGNGYIWNTAKSAYVQMPTYDGSSLMTGNTGNGYAKITYLGN